MALGSWIRLTGESGPIRERKTILLVAWLGFWLGLHLALRGRELRVEAVDHRLGHDGGGCGGAFLAPLIDYFLKG